MSVAGRPTPPKRCWSGGEDGGSGLAFVLRTCAGQVPCGASPDRGRASPRCVARPAAGRVRRRTDQRGAVEDVWIGAAAGRVPAAPENRAVVVSHGVVEPAGDRGPLP